MEPNRESVNHVRETTHDCPREGESVTLCCGKSPFDLPRSDRMTLDSTLVTCGVTSCR